MDHHPSERRLVVVYNPISTARREVEQGVFSRLDECGELYETIRTRFRSYDANVDDIASQLRDGDVVLSAAGDGTASQVVNAVLQSTADAEVGFLPYGNFNDLALAHMSRHDSILNLLSAPTTNLIPLAVTLDNRAWRYAPAYLTIGWTATAASQFDELSSRAVLSRLPRSLRLAQSLSQLASSYLLHRTYYLPHHETSLPSNNSKATTDILAINSPQVARIIRPSRPFYTDLEFGYKEVDMSKIIPNIPFGLQALAGLARLPSLNDVIVHFDEPVSLPIQTEGEFANITAQDVAITKQNTGIRVLHSKEK